MKHLRKIRNCHVTASERELIGTLRPGDLKGCNRTLLDQSHYFSCTGKFAAAQVGLSRFEIRRSSRIHTLVYKGTYNAHASFLSTMQARWVSVFLLIRIVAGFEQQNFSQLSLELTHSIPDDPVAQAILSRALDDGIDLTAFEFSGPALHEIVFWSHWNDTNDSEFPSSLLRRAGNTSKIDVHGPSFFVL